MADALQALRGVGGLAPRAHLGVSPENIWVAKTGDWRLGGFGLSLEVPADQFGIASPYFSEAGGGEGFQAGAGAELALLTGGPRLAYTAPELTVDSGPRVATAAADVFSLGCVAWECFQEAGKRRKPLLDGCGDSLYRHRSTISQRLATQPDAPACAEF